MQLTIREIQKKDNSALARIIRSTLEELNYAIDGTAYTDLCTDHLYEYYQSPYCNYFVAEIDGEIIGGSGIGKIEQLDENYCELQKMYLTTSKRGLGVGKALIEKCIFFAKESGYDLIYLETFDGMYDAQKLYKHYGFEYIDYTMGETGHFSCNVKMIKKL